MRAGTKIYKGKEMPENEKTFIIKSGEECYLSGLSFEKFKYIATIYVFELKKFIEVDYEKIKNYLL